MKALIYKDFMLLKKVMLIEIVVLVIFIWWFSLPERTLIVPVILIVCQAMYLNTLFNYDHACNFNAFVIPALSRTKIVINRYLFAAICSLITSLIGTIVFKIEGMSGAALLLVSVAMFAIPLLLNGIQIPLLIQFGTNTGRVVLVFLLLGLFSFLFGFFPSKLIYEIITSSPVAWFERIQSFASITLIFIVFIAAVLLALGSMLLSICLFKSKHRHGWEEGYFRCLDW